MIGYIAGFFDGEGSIQIRYLNRTTKKGESRVYHFLMVKIANTNKIPLEKIQEMYGGKIDFCPARTPRHRPIHDWRILSNDASRFLEDIYPYLIIKKEQARLAIEFQNKMHYRGNGTLTVKDTEYRITTRNRISELCGKIRQKATLTK